MSEKQIAVSIAVMALVTASIRFLPFLLFSEKRTPAWITRLGGTLPFAVMGMLVVYCLKDVSFASPAGFLPAAVSMAAVAAVHLWKRNTLLSILAGTLLYMALVQFVFV